MRVFLDFDGVLRRESSPKSRLDADCVQCFQSAILSHAEAKVVIASTWRLVHRLDVLRKLFSPDFAARIEGITPDLAEAEEYVRHAEVRAYLSRNGLHGMRWIAIDDDPEQYRPDAPLIRVDPALGFDQACSKRLQDWLSTR
jgi:hypothetical protein